MLKRLLSPFLLLLLICRLSGTSGGNLPRANCSHEILYGFTEASGDWSLGLSD